MPDVNVPVTFPLTVWPGCSPNRKDTWVFLRRAISLFLACTQSPLAKPGLKPASLGRGLGLVLCSCLQAQHTVGTCMRNESSSTTGTVHIPSAHHHLPGAEHSIRHIAEVKRMFWNDLPMWGQELPSTACSINSSLHQKNPHPQSPWTNRSGQQLLRQTVPFLSFPPSQLSDRAGNPSHEAA